MVGLDYILGGLVSLLVAGLISSLKAGLPQRWAARWKGRNARDLFEEEVKE